MKWFTIILSVLLMVGHLSTDAWRLCYWMLDGEPYYIDPFFSPNYSFAEVPGTPDGKIEITWFVDYLADDFLWCITFFVMAQIGKMFSRRIMLIASVFFVYHYFDLAMLFWNFKQYNWKYDAVYFAIGIAIVCLFIPEKKQAIIKSLK